MFWGGFSNGGVTPLVEVPGRMNSQKYADMLQENLLPRARQLAGRNWIYQQDNAPIHVSKHTNDRLNENRVRVLDWPARSPDLNPIENLWGIVTRDVYGKGRQYTTAGLRTAILSAWNNISLNTLKNLIRSMKDRIYAVIYNRGAFTK